jgi:hypothetical protein
MKKLPPIDEHPPAIEIMTKFGLAPDPWQIEMLESKHPQMLLNCCRQSGKTTVVGMFALIEALYKPMTRVVILSRSHRQSREMLKTISFFFDLFGQLSKKRVTAVEIELTNLSRIVSLPCREDTIRGFAAVDLVIIDEAARVPDDLYRAVRPMVAVSKGRIICLSTPYGKRGFFWKAWAQGGADWARIEVPASKCPRIAAEFLERERRELGEEWFRQEYFCSFESVEGLVYPDFKKCVVTQLPAHVADVTAANPEPRNHSTEAFLGGIDFGYRNPFAAIWGVRDRDDILWITGERYGRQQPLHVHAEHLPKSLMWYADPSGANDIASLTYAGFLVRKASNAIRPGIAAVAARLRAGTLRVLEGRCPNLLAEAELYKYGTDGTAQGAEIPLDENNHALDALRYLVCGVDGYRTALPIDRRQELAR